MSPRDVLLVVNTSPLIHLAEADLLHLLHDAAVNVWVPQPVAIEIRAYGDQDPTARALTAHDWLEVRPVEQVAPEIMRIEAELDLVHSDRLKTLQGRLNKPLPEVLAIAIDAALNGLASAPRSAGTHPNLAIPPLHRLTDVVTVGHDRQAMDDCGARPVEALEIGRQVPPLRDPFAGPRRARL